MTRVSADIDDPGYLESELRFGVKVYLNNVFQRNVITAVSGERGHIVRYKRTYDGHLLDDGELVNETIYGRVRIVWPDGRVAGPSNINYSAITRDIIGR